MLTNMASFTHSNISLTLILRAQLTDIKYEAFNICSQLERSYHLHL